MVIFYIFDVYNEAYLVAVRWRPAITTSHTTPVNTMQLCYIRGKRLSRPLALAYQNMVPSWQPSDIRIIQWNCLLVGWELHCVQTLPAPPVPTRPPIGREQPGPEWSALIGRHPSPHNHHSTGIFVLLAVVRWFWKVLGCFDQDGWYLQGC